MSTLINSEQWHNPNAYEEERIKYTEEHQKLKRRHSKPDPATVEAELQLEEELWTS